MLTADCTRQSRMRLRRSALAGRAAASRLCQATSSSPRRPCPAGCRPSSGSTRSATWSPPPWPGCSHRWPAGSTAGPG